MNAEVELKQGVTETPPIQWEQRQEAETDTWDRVIGAETSCHVSQYVGGNNYFWMAKRGENRLSGIAYGRADAMRSADEIMALPVVDFNRKIVTNLQEELLDIERRILRLSPSMMILPGFHVGYEAGVADVRKRVEMAIEAVNGEPS